MLNNKKIVLLNDPSSINDLRLEDKNFELLSDLRILAKKYWLESKFGKKSSLFATDESSDDDFSFQPKITFQVFSLCHFLDRFTRSIFLNVKGFCQLSIFP